MSYNAGKKLPIFPLLIIYFISLSLRLVPTLLIGGMPFYDSYTHYEIILSYLIGQDRSVFQKAHVGFYSLNIVITSFTGIPVIIYARFFPPFFDSLTIIPVYLLTDELLRNKRAALCASLFFGVAEIIVLRQSYLIPEGYAIYLMILIFYLILKTVYSGKFLRYSFLSSCLFYCICAFHNLTAAMTFLPLLAALFFIPLVRIRPLKSFSEPRISPNEFKNLFMVSIAFTFIFIFWAKEQQFVSFFASFISLDVTSMISLLRGEETPTQTGFTEHYIVTRQITLLDLVAMASGSVLIFIISIFGFLRLLRLHKKDFRLYFLLIWTLTMVSNFLLNLLIDSMFSAGVYGQQSYRAWIFMLIPLIILASKRISEIKDDLIFQTILVSFLSILFLGSIWFVGYIMEAFPHPIAG